MRRWSTAGATIACAVVAVGAVHCGGDDSTIGGESDSGVDAPIGDATKPDTGSTDGGHEAAADTGSDVTADAPPVDAADASEDVSDAGSDVTDATDAADASDAAPLLGCTTWRYAAPVQLEGLDGTDGGPVGHFGAPLWVGEVAPGHVRVLTQLLTGTTAFRMYDVDTSSDAGAVAVATLDGPNGAGTFQAAHHFDLGANQVTQVLVQKAAADASDNTDLVAYLVDDTMPIAGPLPTPIALGLGGSKLAAMPFDTTTDFAAASYGYSQGATNYYALGVERGTTAVPGTPGIVSLSPNVDDFLFLALAHAGGNVYVFGSNGASITGASVWKVADTAVVTKPLIRPFDISGRTFETGTRPRTVDIAPGKAAGTSNIAYYTMALDDSSSALEIASVSGAQLDTVTAADLTVARSYTDISLNRSMPGSQWWGDDMMLAGPSGTPFEGGAPTGIDVLWVDATGVVHAEQKGEAGLLRDRGVIYRVNASPSSIAAAGARWNVAWVEQRGGGEALLFDTLLCQ
jgi:hypothetical protein